MAEKACMRFVRMVWNYGVLDLASDPAIVTDITRLYYRELLYLRHAPDVGRPDDPAGRDVRVRPDVDASVPRVEHCPLFDRRALGNRHRVIACYPHAGAEVAFAVQFCDLHRKWVFKHPDNVPNIW